jgi:hypothetical protein
LVDEGIGHGRQRELAIGGFVPPGLFRVSAIDVGRLTVHHEMQKIGELNGCELIGPPIEAFQQ